MGNVSTVLAYDKETGVRALALDATGKNYATTALTGEALEAFRARVVEFSGVRTADDFDRIYAEERTLLDENEQKSGYAGEVYLPKNTSHSSVLDDIAEALDRMEAGEVATLDDENGNVYLFCKLVPTPGAYEDEAFATWFSGFSEGLIESLFADACEKLFPNMTVNEAVLNKQPALKEIESDYYY